MAIVECDKCGEFSDDDYFPHVEPEGEQGARDYDLVCEDCFAELEKEAEEMFKSMKAEYDKEKGNA